MGSGERTQETGNVVVARRVPDVLVTGACMGRDCKRLSKLVTTEAMDLAVEILAPPSESHVVIACPGAAYLMCQARRLDEGSPGRDELGQTDQDYSNEAYASGATLQTATDFWKNKQ